MMFIFIYLTWVHVILHYQWQLANWLMKMWIDFMIIKFDFNENNEWHCIHLELNLSEIQLDSNILIRIRIELI
jgi:hypothetical protein